MGSAGDRAFKMSRKQPSLLTKLASALLTLGDVPYEDAKKMTAHQICSLYAFDHYPIRHVDGGPAEAWNLVPRLIVQHRIKTAKIDQPQIAKGRRNEAKTAEFNRRMAAKGTPQTEPMHCVKGKNCHCAESPTREPECCGNWRPVSWGKMKSRNDLKRRRR